MWPFNFWTKKKSASMLRGSEVPDPWAPAPRYNPPTYHMTAETGHPLRPSETTRKKPAPASSSSTSNHYDDSPSVSSWPSYDSSPVASDPGFSGGGGDSGGGGASGGW